MSKVCAKCSKSVYPLEELKCLDKIWHKMCFKCTECGMILNMKNYKGFDKKPYCTAHYPHTKATVVANTPEMARIAQNTKLQSQVKYHEEFEKTIKGSKIEVVDDPESRRIKRLGSLVSDIEYKGTTARRQSVPHTSDSSGIVEEKIHRPSHYKEHAAQAHSTVFSGAAQAHSTVFSGAAQAHSTMFSGAGTKAETLVAARRIGSIADYDPLNENYGSLTQGYHPASRSSSQSQEWEETIVLSPQPTPATPPVFPNTDAAPVAATRDVAKNIEAVTTETIAGNNTEQEVNVGDGQQEENYTSSEPVDSEPVDSGVVDSGTVDSEPVGSGLDTEPVEPVVDEPVVDASEPVEPVVEPVSSQLQQQEEELAVGEQSVDANNELVDMEAVNGTETVDSNGHQQTTDVENEVDTTTNKQSNNSNNIPGPVFQAVYEYEAQDDDEVSFVEGDEIVEVQVIDDGWMFGKVVRTGKSGMLPSNYIEPVITSQQLE